MQIPRYRSVCVDQRSPARPSPRPRASAVGTPKVQAAAATAESCAGLAGTGGPIIIGSVCSLVASVWTRAERWDTLAPGLR